MRTITTRYGNVNLTEDQTLDLGIRKTADGKTYGYVRFHGNGNEFRTKIATVEELTPFMKAVAKQVAKDNFPFDNSDGQKQFHPFNSSNASL